MAMAYRDGDAVRSPDGMVLTWTARAGEITLMRFEFGKV
jgi:hypothetical protein